MAESMYIVRGLNQDGEEFFYTGRAGKEFVSKVRSESFGYVSQTQARARATNLNRMTEIHGYRFVATAYDQAPYVDASNVQEYGLTQKLSNSIRVF